MESTRKSGPSIKAIPAGDNRTRLVCPDCGYIEYTNPKIVVGAVCTWNGDVLLCQRAIAPAHGKWTVPAGFLETGESTAQGAAREVWEEAEARITIESLVGMYEIPRISQVHLFYRARMTKRIFGAGEESLAVDLFPWDAIPWDDLAFPSVAWALDRFRAGEGPWYHTATPRI